MKITTIFSAALLSASMFSYGAGAQTATTDMNANMDTAGQARIIKKDKADSAGYRGSANERATTDDTMATGSVDTHSDQLVPGSGATFSPGEQATGKAAILQDDAPQSRRQ